MPSGQYDRKHIPLSFIEEQFLLEYIECENYQEAGRRVGLTFNQVEALKQRKAFRDEYERLTGTVLGRAEISAQRIADELAKIGFPDLANLPRDEEGKLLVALLPKRSDQIKALELLGKWKAIDMFGKDVGDVNVGVTVNNEQETVEIEERLKLMEKDRASIMGQDENGS